VDICNTALAVDVGSMPDALWPGVAFGFLSESHRQGFSTPVGLAHIQLRCTPISDHGGR